MNESIWAEEFSSYVSLTIFLTLFLKAYRKDREIKRAAAACEPPPPMDSGLRYRIFRARLNRKYFLLELIVWAFVAFSEIEWLRSLKPSQELDLLYIATTAVGILSFYSIAARRCKDLGVSHKTIRMLLSSGLGAAPLSFRILPHILLSRTGHHLQRGYTQRIPLICKIKIASLHQQKCGEVILYSGSFTTGCAQDRPTNLTRAVRRGERARCPLRAG
mgnify:FL=1